MESWEQKLARLRAEQKAKDESRTNVESPLQPGRTPQQLFRDLRVAEETRQAIREDVKGLSDREKPDPIKTYRDELKQKLQYATPSERARLKSRLEILEAKIAENDAAAAEQIRQEDFNANPLVINARALVEGVRDLSRLYPDVPAEKVQRLKAIAAASSEFIDPQHFSRVVSEALSEVESLQLEADERKHREALIETGKSFSTLNSAEAAAQASKARLEAAQKLGDDDGAKPNPE